LRMRADILRGERCGSRIGIGKQKQIGKPGSSARLAILWIPRAGWRAACGRRDDNVAVFGHGVGRSLEAAEDLLSKINPEEEAESDG